MCGLFAWVSSSDPVPEPVFRRAVGRLGHRGPDGSGTWLGETGRTALGHTRLAIRDLEFGRQPLSNEDGTLHLVVNGELYGVEEIACELTRLGHTFATRSDSEIVLHLFEEMGLRCLERLRGEFAFALWDERRQLLFAARDRFGIKPLYWARLNGGVLLASEAKAILAAGVPPAWNRDAYLRTLFLCLPARETLFAGIAQVPPGHYLVSDGRETTIAKYWDLDYPRADAVRLPDDGVPSRVLRDHLEQAIALRLAADVRVGVFLSGGIDSSVVAGMAADACAEPLQSFTVRFAEEVFDEGDVARRTAARIRAAHTEVAVTVGDLVDHWEDAVWHGETLAANAHGVARYMHARAVRRIGCKAVLSGEGADEILAGYSFSLCDWTGSIARSTPRPAGDCASVAAVLGFVPAWMRNAAAERVLLHALLTPEMAAEADCIDACRAAVEDVDVEGQLRGRHPVMQSLYLWARTILPGYILFSDRMEMAHGVEARLPYLDHVLFETVRKFPPRVLMAGDSSKHVLREAAAGYVNDEVARRPKQPFAAPALATGRSAVKHELRSRIRDGIGDQAFFDAAAVRACLDRLDRMEHGADVRFEPALLLIASTLALQRRYGLAA